MKAPAPDPWRAFCDAMDQVQRAQAECRTELLSIEQDASQLVAAALADQPINRSTDQRRMP